MTSFLVTGGTGSFGQAFVRRLLEAELASRVVVFSRDELKQHEMRLNGFADERIRWFIGDVRDRDRLRRAMRGVDVVVHAAAMKQVPACEYNPSEALATNVVGTANVCEAAIDAGVGRVLCLSTDKAVDPVNVYGKSKSLAEHLAVDWNAYAGDGGTRFACTRYGNVISSRGSVLPVFQAQWDAGLPLTVTDPAMTRFVLTLEQGVQFVLDSLARMAGGEVFVPKLPAVSVATIAEAVAWPRMPAYLGTGMRQGEKRHELLVSANEGAEDRGEYFVVGAGFPVGLAFSSRDAVRLDVAGFRALAGLGATLEAAL